MTDFESTIDKMLNEYKKERDELKLKLHLAKLDITDEWENLESKIEHLSNKTREFKNATSDASQDIGAAAKLLGEEIGEGLKKIKQHF